MSLLAGPGVVDVRCDCPLCAATLKLQRKDGGDRLPVNWIVLVDSKLRRIGWQSLGWDGGGLHHVCPACQEPPSCAGIAKLSRDYLEAKHKHFGIEVAKTLPMSIARR